jgi:hypothetical protein
MLSSHTGQYAMYVDGDGPAEISLKLPPGDYSVQWVDVITGGKKDVGAFKHPGGEKVLKTGAFRNGVAARISRK